MIADSPLPARDRQPLRKAKIVCTLGPASASDETIAQLLRQGMDVARLNFSHGDHAGHAAMIARLRRVAAAEGCALALLADLQGPKIRTGPLAGHAPVALTAGFALTLTTRAVEGSAALVSTTFPTLAREVQPGDRLLLSDGLLELRVGAVAGDDVHCEVVTGGLLKEHQGINLPGTAAGVPSLTEKDRADLAFALEQGVDLVALSFVRTAADVAELQRLIGDRADAPPVIAKLEKPQAIEHLDAILEVADAVMVARGDLGVELAPERVPIIQKEIIRRAALFRKPVITATQMLESMIEHPRPTRAEASDVANAIFDGTDAVMLSGETAVGKYPAEAVAMMARIVLAAEADLAARPPHSPLDGLPIASIEETICESVAHAACELPIRAIAVFTESGATARLISKYRPPAPIYAFTPSDAVCGWLNLLWGVRPLRCEPGQSAGHLSELAERELSRLGVVAPGDVMAIVTGTRMSSGSTNLMRLQTVPGAEAGNSATGRHGARFSPLRQRGNH
jgi:pyruvate kinase